MDANQGHAAMEICLSLTLSSIPTRTNPGFCILAPRRTQKPSSPGVVGAGVVGADVVGGGVKGAAVAKRGHSKAPRMRRSAVGTIEGVSPRIEGKQARQTFSPSFPRRGSHTHMGMGMDDSQGHEAVEIDISLNVHSDSGQPMVVRLGGGGFRVYGPRTEMQNILNNTYSLPLVAAGKIVPRNGSLQGEVRTLFHESNKRTTKIDRSEGKSVDQGTAL